MSPDLLSVVVRTLAFISLFQAAGVALFLLLFGVSLPRSGDRIRRLGLWTALAGMLLLALHQGLEAARMADGFPGLFDAALQRLAWAGSSGNAALLEMIGLAVIALGLALKGQPAARIASTGALILAFAFTFTGHTSVHPQRALLAPLLALHLLLVSFWFGALLPLTICSRHESRRAVVSLLRAFSGVAGPLVPGIGVAGLTMAVVLIPASQSWRTAYGVLLLAKIAAFGALLLLGGWNRWRLVPAMARDAVPTAAQALRRSIAIEYLLMLGVLAATAVLTTFYSPVA